MTMFTRSGRPARSRRLYAPVVALAVALGLSGCDLTEPDDVIVLRTSASLDFEFVDLSAGQQLNLNSEETLNLESFLRGEGFSKDEVVSATVENIEIRNSLPIDVDLSIYQSLTFELNAGGGNVVEVAVLDSPPAEDSADMNATGRDVGAIVRASSFRGVLNLRGTTAADFEDNFLLEINMDIRVNVEGV